MVLLFVFFFLFQAEGGIRDLVRSRGLGDVYKRQAREYPSGARAARRVLSGQLARPVEFVAEIEALYELSLIHI